MSIRRTGLLVLVIVLLAPAAAFATGHNADLSLGGGGASGSTLGLFHSTLALPCSKPGPPKNLSIVVSDFSVYNGSENGTDQTLIGYLGGARWTILPMPGNDTSRKFTPSAHFLLGVTKIKGGGKDFSVAAGGALDVMLGQHNSSEAGMGVRFLVDYLVRTGDAHNLTRFSAEGFYQWGHRHHK